MRGLVLLLAVFLALCIALPFPYAGVLLWTWFSLQAPHREVYGFVQTAPVNFVIAFVTIAAWLFSAERKLPRADIILVTIVLFLAWVTFNGFFAFDPSRSWPYWDQTWKIFALGLLIATMATSRVRIHALLWVIVLSLFYFGVKGGIFTLATGGHFHVEGPPETIIADNNQLAVALLMTLPIAYYLRTQTANRLVASGLLAGIVLTIIAILGSYSRGAFIGLGALALMGLLRMRHRVRYLIAAGMLAMFSLAFMPEGYFLRMQSIGAAGTDVSFEGRVTAWKVAWMYACDHFPFGAGFIGPALSPLFHSYFPGKTVLAAHSIYFQVLGEQGFAGLVLYGIILAAAFLRCSRIIAATRRAPELRWISGLVTAIQTSLVVFCVAAAALSMAYYDLFVICVTLLPPLRDLASSAPAGRREEWIDSGALVRNAPITNSR
ncbi:MAG: putative O-glycosylation ligase, exosortase A system-associated [Rhizomicrobium sp.]